MRRFLNSLTGPVIAVDENVRVIDANDAALATLGTTRTRASSTPPATSMSPSTRVTGRIRVADRQVQRSSAAASARRRSPPNRARSSARGEFTSRNSVAPSHRASSAPASAIEPATICILCRSWVENDTSMTKKLTSRPIRSAKVTNQPPWVPPSPSCAPTFFLQEPARLSAIAVAYRAPPSGYHAGRPPARTP